MSAVFTRDDEYFMRAALAEARIAFDEGEIPIGAVIVCEGRIIARAHNEVERLLDPTAHAEVLAITSATQSLGGKFLSSGCTLYVAKEEKFGYSCHAPSLFPKAIRVEGGLLEVEARELMQSFFATRR